IGGIKAYKKQFPKGFQEKTVVKEDGYPLYKRRYNQRKVSKTIRGRQVEFDNRWVMPYSPYLSRKFNAHINVEVYALVNSLSINLIGLVDVRRRRIRLCSAARRHCDRTILCKPYQLANE